MHDNDTDTTPLFNTSFSVTLSQLNEIILQAAHSKQSNVPVDIVHLGQCNISATLYGGA